MRAHKYLGWITHRSSPTHLFIKRKASFGNMLMKRLLLCNAIAIKRARADHTKTTTEDTICSLEARAKSRQMMIKQGRTGSKGWKRAQRAQTAYDDSCPLHFFYDPVYPVCPR
jgi:hypothetical protein